jgi:hypothetical protein
MGKDEDFSPWGNCPYFSTARRADERFSPAPVSAIYLRAAHKKRLSVYRFHPAT